MWRLHQAPIPLDSKVKLLKKLTAGRLLGDVDNPLAPTPRVRSSWATARKAAGLVENDSIQLNCRDGGNMLST